jgi:propionyl-CoA carboxylase alpha chain/3-methylcrotonyl-CoA carboxylase alpha subunit
MIRRLLIANRGEIARRVIRTARRMGIETVAVYSDADRHAPHVREADHAVHIGPSPARESYLDQAKVLAAAQSSGADAIHPGYGFLSENAAFAEAVIAAGLIWVGPPPGAIRAMGLKDAAKRLMAEAGVPTTPGYLGEDQSPERLEAEAARIGYPVLIKAVAGGGGKGMRKVEAAADFAAALAGAKREAAASFGDDRVLLETYVTRPRHIEVQVFADAHGNVVHLFERDCSLQRRHQKVVEEAPAPGMDDATRAAVTGAAVRAAEAVGYRGAGTVEFIADASEGLRADRIWFMEMNTRLQVEHPVTEMVTGQDLVDWQLRVAAGEPLPLKQDQIALAGWAMEARLYAENPANKFLPSTGKLEHFVLPEATGGVRIDSGVEEGGEVTPFYDPMIAKLIAHAPTREAAARKLADACGSTRIWPVKTNAGFLTRVLRHPDFLAAEVDTGFIEQRLEELVSKPPLPREHLEIATEVVLENWRPYEALDNPWAIDGARGFRLNADSKKTVRVLIDGLVVDAPLPARKFGERGFRLMAFGEISLLMFGGDIYEIAAPTSLSGDRGGGTPTDGQLRSPMPGRIVSVGAAAGAKVAKGQAIVTLEAMKMEHALTAPFDGVLAELSAKAGEQVSEGVVLARIEPA